MSQPSITLSPGSARRVRFNEMTKCVLFNRGPGFDTLPHSGGVSLALDNFVAIQYEPLSVNIDETHGVSTPRRHPARREAERLPTLSQQKRRVSIFLEKISLLLLLLNLFFSRPTLSSPKR